MNSTDTNIGRDLAQQLTQTAQAAGRELSQSSAAIGEYTAERISHLKFAAKEPGYEEAVQAERDAIVLFAAGKAADEGDSVDARILGLVEGAIRTAVVAAA